MAKTSTSSARRGRHLVGKDYTSKIRFDAYERERDREAKVATAGMIEGFASGVASHAETLKTNMKGWEQLEAGGEELHKKGRATNSELIIPLPGETKKTFLKGVDDLLNSNASSLTIYTLMMLHGTEFQNPKFRENWGYKGKYRIVPLNFGEYENTRIFDYEEAGIATKDMPFEDYIYI